MTNITKLKRRGSLDTRPRHREHAFAQTLDGAVYTQAFSNTDNAQLLECRLVKLEKEITADIVCPEDVGMVGTFAGCKPPGSVVVGPGLEIVGKGDARRRVQERSRGKRRMLAANNEQLCRRHGRRHQKVSLSHQSQTSLSHLSFSLPPCGFRPLSLSSPSSHGPHHGAPTLLTGTSMSTSTPSLLLTTMQSVPTPLTLLLLPTGVLSPSTPSSSTSLLTATPLITTSLAPPTSQTFGRLSSAMVVTHLASSTASTISRAWVSGPSSFLVPPFST